MDSDSLDTLYLHLNSEKQTDKLYSINKQTSFILTWICGLQSENFRTLMSVQLWLVFYQTQRYIKNIIPIIKIIAIEQNSINIRKWSNNGSCKYVKEDSLMASACCLIVSQLLDSPFWLFEEFLSNETFSIFISFF